MAPRQRRRVSAAESSGSSCCKAASFYLKGRCTSQTPIVCVLACPCAQLTHSFEGGVLVESHGAVVAVRVRKSLSKGSVGRVIQMVLFWVETSRHTDHIRRMWLQNEGRKNWTEWNEKQVAVIWPSLEWKMKITSMPHCDPCPVCAMCREPCHFKMHHGSAQLIKHVSSLEFAPRHQVGPAFLYLVRQVQWIHLHSLQRFARCERDVIFVSCELSAC